MGYIYRVKDNFDFNPWTPYKYFPVKKKYYTNFEPISFYKNDDNGGGIYGLGKILEYKALNSSKIHLEEGIKLFDSSFFQIKVRFSHYSFAPYIDNKILKHFPSYNKKQFENPINPYTLYWDCGLSTYMLYVLNNFYISRASIFKKNVWEYYIHFLREMDINLNVKNKLLRKYKQCNQCGFKSDSPYFFELHDTVKIDLEKDYVPVNIDNFIVLCPNCHKLIHQKLKDEIMS